MKWWLATVGVLSVCAIVAAAVGQVPYLVAIPVAACGAIMAWIMYSTGSDAYPWAVGLALVALIAHEAVGGQNLGVVVAGLAVALIAHGTQARRRSAAIAAA